MVIQNVSYYEKFFKINGEKLESKPSKLFESAEVYLIVDIDLKTIWIWAGRQSRLFQRYIAANLAGKLKSKKDFHGFKHEVIKDGLEPSEFLIILDEVKRDKADIQYPGQTRSKYPRGLDLISNSGQSRLTHPGKNISSTEKYRIKNILSEIREMQMHIRYSMEHIGKRIAEIEKILE